MNVHANIATGCRNVAAAARTDWTRNTTPLEQVSFLTSTVSVGSYNWAAKDSDD